MRTPTQELALAKLFGYLRKPWRKPTWRRKAVSGNLDARDRQAWRNDVSSPYLRQRSAWAYRPNQFTSQIALTPGSRPTLVAQAPLAKVGLPGTPPSVGATPVRPEGQLLQSRKAHRLGPETPMGTLHILAIGTVTEREDVVGTLTGNTSVPRMVKGIRV